MLNKKKNDIPEVTLLSLDQALYGGIDGSRKIEAIKKLGSECAASDLALTLGAECFYDAGLNYKVACAWFISSNLDWPFKSDEYVAAIGLYEQCTMVALYNQSVCVLPALRCHSISHLAHNGANKVDGLLEVEYGEYPQCAVDVNLAENLEREYLEGNLRKTGKTYADPRSWANRNEISEPTPIERDEFYYNGKKYARFEATPFDGQTWLSNEVKIKTGDPVWLEVQPITWYYDKKTKILLSKKALFAGIGIENTTLKYLWHHYFRNTDMYTFLNTYFVKDIVPSVVNEMTKEEKPKIKKLRGRIY